MSNLIEQLKAARRASVPIVAINTPDPEATIRTICAAVNGKAPKVEWDVVRGMRSRNEAAAGYVASLGENDPTVNNPLAAFVEACKLPPGSVLFVHLANRWIADPMCVQAVWNIRDLFKQNRRTLILLSRDLAPPAELSEDIITLDEPLPDAGKLTDIIVDQHKCAGLECDDTTAERAVDALLGLSAFAAEQVTAMSLRKTGLDVDALWERKRQQIEQTPGLKVFRGGDTFEQIGGVETVKTFVGRIMAGKARPNAVVFVDEIEKMIGGARGDLSGVTQDQLGAILSYMQDNECTGMILIGPPGAAKSAVAKAAGSEAGIPTIQLDLGAAKGSLVGQSEQQLRQALKVITAVSSGRSLWIATCNSISDLPPELRRRFTLGTFFFDLPDGAEREVIWDIYLERYDINPTTEAGLSIVDFPDDSGWTGAEIKQCCDLAWRLGCTLKEAAEFVVPVSRSAADQIGRLRKMADGRFLSASRSGVYRMDANNQADWQEERTRERAVAIVE